MADEIWNGELEDKLIECWQETPCLFDISSTSYSNRLHKRKAHEEIGFKLNVTSEQVIKHMHCLRTQFCRLSKTPPSGSGVKKLTGRQKWILEKLGFLKQHLKAKPSQSNLVINNDEEDNTSQMNLSMSHVITDEPTDTSSLDLERSVEHVAEDPPGEEPVNDISADEPKAKKVFVRPGVQKRYEKKKADEELAILKSLAAAVAQPEPQIVAKDKEDKDDDEDMIFGRYIVNEMKQIKDVQAKLVLKHTITDALFRARMGSAHAYVTPSYGGGRSDYVNTAAPVEQFQYQNLNSSYPSQQPQNSMRWYGTDGDVNTQQSGGSFTQLLQECRPVWDYTF